MGTIRNGANGGFSGKAGSLIGSSWNGIDYIKGLYKKRTKPATQKQIEQQLKFKLAIRFLRPIANLLYLTFKAFAKSKRTGLNVALQQVLFKAIRGNFPNYELDYSNVMISDGGLAVAECTATAVPSNEIQLTWETDTNTHNANEQDLVSVLIYDPSKNFFKSFTDIATRLDGEKTIRVAASMVGKPIHVYMYLRSASNKYSPSFYAGEVIVE